MAEYFTGLCARVMNQAMLLLGGVLVLAFMISGVSSYINESGERLLGRGYRYVVAPGIVCHELGHVLGCAVTGTRVYYYDPFNFESFAFAKRHRHHCYWCHHGHGFIREHKYSVRPLECLMIGLKEFVIGLGPIVLGTAVIWVLSWLMACRSLIPKHGDLFPIEPVPDSATYWKRTTQAALRMLCSILSVWRWKSLLNVFCMYLVVVVGSEMFISWCDLQDMWIGLITVACMLGILNLVPAIGFKLTVGTYLFARCLLPVHVLLVFVIAVDVVLFVVISMVTYFF